MSRLLPQSIGVGICLLLVSSIASVASANAGLAARRASKDIARAALPAEMTPLSRRLIRQHLGVLKREADKIRLTLGHQAGNREILDALNAHFFGPSGFTAITDATAPESLSVARVLDTRRGTCVGLVIVYLALAQRLGLDAHGVATPDHLYVRVRLDDHGHNVDVMEGGLTIPDDTYRRRHRIDPASVAPGVFLRDLTNAEVIAHLLSNQAVALGQQGRLDDALARYGAALELHQQLVAAWYNRGIDLMNAGRIEEALASFDRAIQLHPADAQAHNNRGLARFKLGDIEAARSDWLRALELHPGLREAEENLRRLTAP